MVLILWTFYHKSYFPICAVFLFISAMSSPPQFPHDPKTQHPSRNWISKRGTFSLLKLGLFLVVANKGKQKVHYLSAHNNNKYTQLNNLPTASLFPTLRKISLPFIRIISCAILVTYFLFLLLIFSVCFDFAPITHSFYSKL